VKLREYIGLICSYPGGPHVTAATDRAPILVSHKTTANRCYTGGSKLLINGTIAFQPLFELIASQLSLSALVDL